jgi:ribose-phosphate pyrophosphokinase
VSEIIIQSLPSSASDAKRLASRLGTAAAEIAIHRFPDGELGVSIAPAAPVTIIYAPLDRPNEKLLSILFAAEALRRNGAKRLVLVAPYLCYMRQDIAFQPEEAISQKAVGGFLAGLVDRVITVHAHLHRTADIHDVFPGIEADNLSAMPAIADALLAIGLDPRTVIVGPDAESRLWVSELAARLGVGHAVAQKTRRGDRSVEIALADPTVVRGRPVLLVDDIVSSGATLVACARNIIEAGATSVDAIVTHALFPLDTTDEFVRAGIRSIRSTNSVSHPTNAIALDGVLAAALRNEIGDGDSAETST